MHRTNQNTVREPIIEQHTIYEDILSLYFNIGFTEAVLVSSKLAISYYKPVDNK